MSEITELSYTVPEMTCGGCRSTVSAKLSQLAGVASFDIDLPTRSVIVRGEEIDDETVRAAIADAGFEPA